MSERVNPYLDIRLKQEARPATPEESLAYAEDLLRNAIAPPQIAEALQQRTEALLKAAQRVAWYSGVKNADKILRDAAAFRILNTNGAGTLPGSAAESFFYTPSTMPFSNSDEFRSTYLDRIRLDALSGLLDELVARNDPNLKITEIKERHDDDFDSYVNDAMTEVVRNQPAYSIFESFDTKSERGSRRLTPRERELHLSQAATNAAAIYGEHARSLESSLNYYGTPAPNSLFHNSMVRAEIAIDDKWKRDEAQDSASPFEIAQEWLLKELQTQFPDSSFHIDPRRRAIIVNNYGYSSDEIKLLSRRMSERYDPHPYNFAQEAYTNILKGLMLPPPDYKKMSWSTFLQNAIALAGAVDSISAQDQIALFYGVETPFKEEVDEKETFEDDYNKLYQYMITTHAKEAAAGYFSSEIDTTRVPNGNQVTFIDKEREEQEKKKTVGQTIYMSPEVLQKARLVTESMAFPAVLTEKPDSYELALRFADNSYTYNVAGFAFKGIYEGIAYYDAVKDPYRECPAVIPVERYSEIAEQLHSIELHELGRYFEEGSELTPITVEDFANEAPQHFDYTYDNNEIFSINNLQDFAQFVEVGRLKVQCTSNTRFGELVLRKDFTVRPVSGFVLSDENRIDGVRHAQLEVTWNGEKYIIDLTPELAEENRTTTEEQVEQVVEKSAISTINDIVRTTKDTLAAWNMGARASKSVRRRGPQFLELSSMHPFRRVMEFMHQLAPTTYEKNLTVLPKLDIQRHQDDCARLLNSLENLKNNPKLQRALGVELNSAALNVMRTNLLRVQAELGKLLDERD